ncbi:MAG: adenylate/guanylate cyclase domain-containing protein [Candidatus Meridianibacter frigidus]|nr:MAG: adenylate/guanylate cyclase domain-containing protein [Candidatus Eremiobacteraeota bacterium]
MSAIGPSPGRLGNDGPWGLPSGTVTFLFTDIEGSTVRWERRPQAMQVASRTHDDIIREAIESRRGSVFKALGDGFCAAFPSASDAVAAALDAQRKLDAVDWSAIDGLRVRMAIHSGTADERDGDYFGPAVNRVSRLLSIGHGGQVLISGVAADLALEDMPEQCSLRDLGPHRLKDLSMPEQVHQLTAPGLRAEFPHLQSLDALPNNLPLQLTSFIGRETELAAIRDLLQRSRLVTLVGSGGVGKTRVSLQIGAEVLDRFEHGVYLVELATLTDSALIPTRIAAAIGLDDPGEATSASLIRDLKEKHMLLILDNCEHLVRPVASIADELLHGCRRLRILASSRENLAIPGESIFRMPSLEVPPKDAEVTPQSAFRYSAVQLFIERAFDVTGDFQMTAANAPIVANICRQLDGIALAIELAAPRLKVLSVKQLDARLTQRFRLLTGGARTALPRQQTLRALIDWSYDLLTEAERSLFRRIGIFSGGFTLDAATEVCGDVSTESWSTVDLLCALVGKSMVVAELERSEARYRLLESTRQYALERLRETGEYQNIAERHAVFFARVTRDAEMQSLAEPDEKWLPALKQEADNLRAAMDASMSGEIPFEIGARMVADLFPFWFHRVPEGVRRIEAALADARTTDPELRAALHLADASMALVQNAYDRARPAAIAALHFYKEKGDRLLAALASVRYARAYTRIQPLEATRAALSEALTLFRQHKLTRTVSAVLSFLGTAEHQVGDPRRAREYFEESVAIADRIGDARGAARSRINLAEVLFQLGEYESALRTSEGIDPADETPYNMGVNLLNQSAYLIALKRYAEAKVRARKAIPFGQELENEPLIAVALQHVGTSAFYSGSSAAACATILYVTDRILAGHEVKRDPTEFMLHQRVTALLAQRLGRQELQNARAAAGPLTLEDAIERALAL